MNVLFDDFAEAHNIKNGYMLAQTLSPVPPVNNPAKLKSIFQSTGSGSVKGDIRHFIKTSTSHRRSLDKDETTGWTEVYTAYWCTAGEIVAGKDGKVNFSLIASLACETPSDLDLR